MASPSSNQINVELSNGQTTQLILRKIPVWLAKLVEYGKKLLDLVNIIFKIFCFTIRIYLCQVMFLTFMALDYKVPREFTFDTLQMFIEKDVYLGHVHYICRKTLFFMTTRGVPKSEKLGGG